VRTRFDGGGIGVGEILRCAQNDDVVSCVVSGILLGIADLIQLEIFPSRPRCVWVKAVGYLRP